MSFFVKTLNTAFRPCLGVRAAERQRPQQPTAAVVRHHAAQRN